MKTISDHWWTSDKDSCHGQVFQDVRAIEDQGGTRNSMRTWLDLYLDREIADFSTIAKSRHMSLFGGLQGVNLNVIKSCIDTVQAKIVSHRPRAQYTTVEGRFGDRQKAKKLEQWTQSLLNILLDNPVYKTKYHIYFFLKIAYI